MRASPLNPQLSEGDVLENCYRVGEKIGVGRAATVHAATHLTTGRLVAIKWPTHAAAVTTLLAQARLAARVRHPAVLQIYEVGCHDGSYYSVLELVLGQSLASCIHHRCLESGHWLAAFDAVLGGVHALHEKGLIHRDLKPSNILVSRDDFGRMTHAKVVDFGSVIARDGPASVRDWAPSAAEQGGSARYIAPEQAADPRCNDPRTDVYALGVTLRSCVQSLSFGQGTEARRAWLLQIAAKASAFDPNDRFPSALSLRLALRAPRSSSVSLAGVSTDAAGNRSA